jgi:hypothetical protein
MSHKAQNKVFVNKEMRGINGQESIISKRMIPEVLCRK